MRPRGFSMRARGIPDFVLSSGCDLAPGHAAGERRGALRRGGRGPGGDGGAVSETQLVAEVCDDLAIGRPPVDEIRRHIGYPARALPPARIADRIEAVTERRDVDAAATRRVRHPRCRGPDSAPAPGRRRDDQGGRRAVRRRGGPDRGRSRDRRARRNGTCRGTRKRRRFARGADRGRHRVVGGGGGRGRRHGSGEGACPAGRGGHSSIQPRLLRDGDEPADRACSALSTQRRPESRSCRRCSCNR